MNFSHLTDEMLDSANIQIAKTEFDILSKVLHHLRETDRRRLFSKYGFETINEYAVKRMGYSPDQADRRVSAMRLLKEVPQIQEKIESGALNLTHLTRARALFRQEQKAQVHRTAEEKIELLAKIEHQPRHMVEKTLESESLIKPLLVEASDLHSRKPADFDQLPLRLQKKIKRLMEVRAHTNANDWITAVDQALDLALEKWDPMIKAQNNIKPAKVNSAPARNMNHGFGNHRANIPSAMRMEVYMRCGGKCAKCSSRRLIQIDHIVPVAKGGRTELSNLRLLCRSCNQRHAIESYGLRKMNRYLREPIRIYAA